MSVKALSAVWEESRATGSDLLVLLAMADWADHQGRCYPSYSQLAEKARVSRATVAASVARLVDELQEVARVRGGHAPDPTDDAPSKVRVQRRNQYQITLLRPRREVVQNVDHLKPSQVVQPLDHQVVQESDQQNLEVVQSIDAGSPIHAAQVVQSARSHIRNRPSVLTVSRPSATTVAAAVVERFRHVLDPSLPADALALVWNEVIAEPLRPCQSMTAARRRRCRARLVERPFEEWRVIFARLAASSFCQGENRTGFVASFDWVISAPDVGVKALEGQYDDRLTAADRQAASEFRFRVGWGDGCGHEPTCPSREACDGRLARSLRQRERVPA